MFFPCSGSANVGEAADKAARELMHSGKGKMFCLAGLGADIQGMVQAAWDADLNLIIDGCPMGCAKKVFDRHGISNYKCITVTELGIEKAKTRCTDEQVKMILAKAEEIIEKEA
ncbi:MAG TPA: putative zinc-binding protein [Phycisphaerae bacterium]|nr:putative zinc-binding protein [Phycisphaerae bacterium]HPS53450.1 putative zinc-binding protein [Phycisphaerae bacterium]